jgi:hypothetical protein
MQRKERWRNGRLALASGSTMKNTRVLNKVWIAIVCLIGHVADLQAKEFVSMAKLIVGGADTEARLEDGRPVANDFYVTQIEIIESSDLLWRAQAKLRGITHESPPEAWKAFRWDGPKVTVKAKRMPDSRIINVAMFCDSPEVPQELLNCLIDAFFYHRKMLREQALVGRMNTLLTKLVAQKKLVDDLKAKQDYVGADASESLKKQHTEATTTYQKVFKEAEDLQKSVETPFEIIQILSRAERPTEFSR